MQRQKKFKTMQYANVVVLIVPPLKHIMEDQIEEMEDLGIASLVLSTKEKRIFVQRKIFSLDGFSSLPKPLASLNPRWRSLYQIVLVCQNTPTLQATKFQSMLRNKDSSLCHA